MGSLTMQSYCYSIWRFSCPLYRAFYCSIERQLFRLVCPRIEAHTHCESNTRQPMSDVQFRTSYFVDLTFHIDLACLLSFTGQFSPVEVTIKVVPTYFVDVAPPQLKGNPEIEIAILVVKDMANFLF